MARTRSTRRQEALRRYAQEYEQLKAELRRLGYVLQGSVTERWMKCGNGTCRCQSDPTARHGPYYQWSWKSSGRTSSVYLDEEQAALCEEWVASNRDLERILKKMRALSLRVARLHKIPRK